MGTKQKIWQLDPWDDSSTFLALREKEVVVAASNSAFLQVTGKGISLYGGTPSNVTLGTLSPAYVSFVRDTPWPMSMLASFYAPPRQLPNVAMFENLPTLAKAAMALTALVG